MPALTVVRGTDCIATEDDGLTWAVVSTLPATIASGARGAGFGGAYYVSDGSVSLRSTDGVNWETAGNHGFSVPVPILYNGSVFVATNTSSSHVARSTDGGQTWSAPIAVPIPPNVPGVIGTTFCIMRSSNGNRATSADGLTWSSGAGGVIVFAGHTTTSFSRNRIVHAGAPGQALGSAFTSDGLSWTSGGVIGTLGELAFNGVACSETGSAVVVGSQAGTGTFRSADGGVSWSPKVDTANFQTTGAGPVWVGSANTFIIPLATGGICERTTDGGASWSTIPNPGSLNIVTHQTAMFVLPGGLPGPEEAFWTNRILTQEVI